MSCTPMYIAQFTRLPANLIRHMTNQNLHLATTAGLTLGLLSLDPLQLHVQQRSGTPKEQAQAARLLPLLRHTHRALVSMVLCNAAVSATLPLCLDRMLNPISAILLSSTAVVIFSEVFPQAIFSR